MSLRDVIAAAYPSDGFRPWAALLIERLQAVADGALIRLLVICPLRMGLAFAAALQALPGVLHPAPCAAGLHDRFLLG